MARYDGSPDAFARFRDDHPDVNLDRWPDAPPAPSAEGTNAEEPDEAGPEPLDGYAGMDGIDPYDGMDDPVENVVDLRPTSSPTDWATSYTPGAYSSFSLDGPAAPPPSEEPEPETTYEGRRRHTAAAAVPPEPVNPVPVNPLPAFVPSPTTENDWNIPAKPIGPTLSGAESLTADSVLRYQRLRPQSGWRRNVYEATRGKVNLGPSPADRRRAELIAAARTPVAGCHRLAVISLKGGVGKTTTTAALGAMFADLRGDRVIAVDANPDRGTLGERVPRESGATVRHLLDARHRLERYADVRRFTSQAPTRLEVLASDADPSASLAYSEQDYRDTVSTLERFYNLILTDCGTGLLHSAMHGILGLANSLVVVSSASLDGARSASATLDWLEAHGLEELAREAVVVISSVRPGGGIVDVLQLEDHFAARCRAVVIIPYDPHLEAGGVLDLDELALDTRDAYRELAASVAEGFPSSR